MTIKRIFKFLTLTMLLFLPFKEIFAQTPLTVAELSDYRSTSRVKDVENFFLQLQSMYPENIIVSSIGKTFEGREIPLIIAGDPAPVQPCFTDKPVIMINANIHAGEIEGKEAVQMFVRDLLNGNSSALKKFVFVIIPVFNVDGNEKISPKHRPYQRVKNGVGIRYNGMNMDLNRDFVKLDSPEARALVKTFNKWEPLVFIDMHTTNGSFHQEPLTFTWSMSPAGSKKMAEFIRKSIYPFIKSYSKKKHNIECIPYGHFDNQEKPTEWKGFFGGMVFATGYFGAKGAFSFLDENYAYADYKTRVKAAYSFLDSLLAFMSEETNLQKMLDIKNEFYNLPYAYVYKKTEPVPCGEKITIKGYKVRKDKKTGRYKPDKGKRINYKVDFIGCFKGEKIKIRGAFVFPKGLSPIVEKLKQHGIAVYKLEETKKVKARKYKIEKVEFSDFPFQGRQFVKNIKGKFEIGELDMEKGWFVIPLNKSQRFKQVATALLYPESDDSLLKEGFFNLLIFPSQWSKKPGYYPVYLIDSVKGLKLKLTR